MYSTQNIIMVQDLDYDNHCKFRFGSYVEAHEDCKINNVMEEKTFSGICLWPTARFQSIYKYSP